MTGESSAASSTLHLHLRGGARRKRRPLGQDEQVPGLLWWLAGGMGPPPTGKQLKEMNKRKREAQKRRWEAKQARGGGFFSTLKKILMGNTGGSGPSKGGGTTTTTGTSTSASGTGTTSKSGSAASGTAAAA